ncbi:MAG: aldose 1-epimerase [Parvibaculaceae bacterium]
MAVGSSDSIVLQASRSRLELAPALGGIVTGYRADGFDWLRRASPDPALAGKPAGFSCFPLIPYSDQVRDGAITFRGRRYVLSNGMPLARHGHSWRAPWRVMNRSDSSLEIEYRHNAGDWPSAYVARQAFSLGAHGFSVGLEVENVGREPMPCGMGLHPYFPRTPDVTVTARVDGLWETDAELFPARRIRPPADRDPGRGFLPGRVSIDSVFDGWDGEAVVEWPVLGRRLRMTASEPMRHLVIYSPPGADYFCVEPASNGTDAFNRAEEGLKDTGMIVLDPGQSVRGVVDFRTG